MQFKTYFHLLKLFCYQLYKAKIIIILLITSLFVPVSVVGLYFLNNNFYSISYLYIIILFVFNFINILLLTLKLFSENITNQLDLILITKSFKRQTIFLSKYSVINIFMISIYLIQSLIVVICISFFGSEYLNEAFSYWLITFFGQLFIFIFLLPINSFLYLMLNNVWSSFLNIFIVFLIISTFLFSHFAFSDIKKNNKLTYNSQYKMSYLKISTLNNQLIANETYIATVENANSTLDENSNFNYRNNLNNVSEINNFMIGEWIFSGQYTLYNASLNYENNADVIVNNSFNDSYKSSLIRFYNDEPISIKVLDNNANKIILRTTDLNPFIFDNDQCLDLYVDAFKKVVEINSQFDLSNDLLVAALYNKISNPNEKLWIAQYLSDAEIETIANLTGINAKVPILYYFFKYQDLISFKIPQIYERITQAFSTNFSRLINFLATSNLALNNIYGNLSISSLLNLQDLFPTIEVHNEIKSPNNLDLDFFKNFLIMWNQDQPSILLNDNTTSLINLTNFNYKQDIYNITNYAQWINFIDQNCLTLADLKLLYQNLAIVNKDIYNYYFHPNHLNLKKIAYLNNIKQTSWINYAYVYLICIFTIATIANISTFLYYKNKNYKK